MSASKFTLDTTYEGVELTIHFYATPITPAYISGPPEDCYPEEGGEVEITEIFIDTWEVTALLSEGVVSDLETRCAEYAAAQFGSPGSID